MAASEKGTPTMNKAPRVDSYFDPNASPASISSRRLILRLSVVMALLVLTCASCTPTLDEGAADIARLDWRKNPDKLDRIAAISVILERTLADTSDGRWQRIEETSYNDPEPEVRTAAVQAITRLSEQQPDRVKRVIYGNIASVYVRLDKLRTMGISDTSPEVRIAVTEFWGRAGIFWNEGINSLEKMLQTDENPAVLTSARAQLADLTEWAFSQRKIKQEKAEQLEATYQLRTLTLEIDPHATIGYKIRAAFSNVRKWVVLIAQILLSLVMFSVVGWFATGTTRRFVKVISILVLTGVIALSFFYQSQLWVLAGALVGLGLGYTFGEEYHLSVKVYYERIVWLFLLGVLVWLVAEVQASTIGYDQYLVQESYGMVFQLDLQHIMRQRLLEPLLSAALTCILYAILAFLAWLIRLIFRRRNVFGAMSTALILTAIVALRLSFPFTVVLAATIIIGYCCVAQTDDVQDLITKYRTNSESKSSRQWQGLALASVGVLFLSTWLTHAFLWKFIATSIPPSFFPGPSYMGTVCLAYGIAGLAIGGMAGAWYLLNNPGRVN
jgi:hypothetical protein